MSWLSSFLFFLIQEAVILVEFSEVEILGVRIPPGGDRFSAMSSPPLEIANL